MAYDPDLNVIFDGMNAQFAAITARLDKLEKGVTAPAPAPAPTPAPAPAPAPTMNRQALGFAVPRNELAKNPAGMLDRIAATGARMIRFDFYWDQIERSQGGAFDWAGVEALVSAAGQRGIQVLGILTGKPAWGSDESLSDPADAARFGRFAGAAAARFAGRVDHWQIWNEPNLNRMTPERYVPVLKAAHAEIKRANPRAFVVGAGLSAVPTTTGGSIGVRDWVTRCYALGAKGHYDALAIHPYSYPFDLEHPVDWTGWGQTVRVLRPLMDANGESARKIWITEVGHPTRGTATLTEAGQAKLLADLPAAIRKHPGIGPCFWYSLDDRGGDTANPENWFGLHRPDGIAKPALAALQTAVAALAKS